MMKRMWMVVMLCLLALPFSTAAKERSSGSLDMSKVHRIFIGWAAIDANYSKLGYATRKEWQSVVEDANAHFQDEFRASGLSKGREVIGARNAEDQDSKGYDLYIKPTEVSFDYGYRLHFAADIVDAITGTTLVHLDTKTYGAHFCAMTGCLNKELDKAIEDIEDRIGTK